MIFTDGKRGKRECPIVLPNILPKFFSGGRVGGEQIADSMRWCSERREVDLTTIAAETKLG
jgi:hypothetical protein